MLKALWKQQLIELKYLYFFRKKGKDGKPRTKAGGMVAVYILVWTVLFGGFFAAGTGMMALFHSGGMDWFYFSIFGLVALFFGVVGSVRNTYSTLYHARDNEMLLSMPVKPRDILLSRMFSVLIQTAFFISPTMLAGSLAYWVVAKPGFAGYLFPIAVMVLLCFLAVALDCFFGWIMAMISSRMKRKNIVSVALGFILFIGYYYVYFNAKNLLMKWAENADKIQDSFSRWALPVYWQGQAAAGDGLSLLFFALTVFVLFALCMWIMSRSFIGITTRKTAAAKKAYQEKQLQESSPQKALIRRELKHITSSTTIMMNSEFGTILLPIASVVLVCMKKRILTALAPVGISNEVFAILTAAMMMVVVGLNAYNAATVSLEGKNLWILRTLPLSSWEILKAKRNLQILLTAGPALILMAALAYVFSLTPLMILLLIPFTLAHAWWWSLFELKMNLKHPMLEWTNEAAPVKQSGSVAAAIFGGFGVAYAIATAGFTIRLFLPLWVLPLTGTVFASCIALLYERWMKRKGIALWDEIQA